MSISKQCRDVLRLHGPMTAAQVARYVTTSDTLTVSQLLSQGYKIGTLERDGPPPYTYRYKCEPVPACKRPEHIERLRRMGEARRLPEEERRARRKARQRAADARRRPYKPVRMREQIAAASSLKQAPTVQVVRIETVSEWIQRTGQQPQRLESWVTSKANALRYRYEVRA